jgi:DNA-binding response OmpR family regulator
MTTDHPLVLIIEDELPLRQYLRTTLRSHGYRVEEAGTWEEGRAAAGRLRPDVILLDLGLPDGDGLSLARELRTRDLTPIIVVSARGREEDKILALDMGVDDYLTKPFGSGELLARIRVALRHAAEVSASPSTCPATSSPSCPSWSAPRARSSPTASSSRRSGGTPPRPRRPTCGSTWPACARSWRRIRPAPGSS